MANVLTAFGHFIFIAIKGMIDKCYTTLMERVCMFDLLRAIAFSHSTEYEFREFLRQYHERMSAVYGAEPVNAEQAMSVAAEVLDPHGLNEPLVATDASDDIPVLKPDDD